MMISLISESKTPRLGTATSKRLDEMSQLKSFITKTPTNGYSYEIKSSSQAYEGGFFSDNLLKITETASSNLDRNAAQQSAIQAREYHNNRHLDGLSDYERHFLQEMTRMVDYRSKGRSSPRINMERDRFHLDRVMDNMGNMSYPMKRVLLDFYNR